MPSGRLQLREGNANTLEEPLCIGHKRFVAQPRIQCSEQLVTDENPEGREEDVIGHRLELLVRTWIRTRRANYSGGLRLEVGVKPASLLRQIANRWIEMLDMPG